MSCSYHHCKLDLLDKSDRTTKENKHVRKYHTWKTPSFELSGSILLFLPVPTKNMKYVCECLKTFTSSEALRTHIFGANYASKVQRPCPDIARVATRLQDKKYAYRGKHQNNVVYIAWPQYAIPEGIKDDMDGNGQEDMSDVEQEDDQDHENNDITSSAQPTC
ncbi:hypothetical protein BGX34_003156 [Mortierella sp. NVP85]|nr:hypothetical protein BGX34_003156 [Mortierella sp. NVP85]